MTKGHSQDVEARDQDPETPGLTDEGLRTREKTTRSSGWDKGKGGRGNVNKPK